MKAGAIKAHDESVLSIKAVTEAELLLVDVSLN